MMWRAAVLAAGLALSGCAAMNTVSSDVTSYSQWPDGREPGRYAFERLPSQQAQPEQQDALEQAARPALEGAGFTPAAEGAAADVSVQLSSRITRYDRSSMYDDPFFWHGGMFWGRGWGSPFWGSGIGLRYESPWYDREVAVLIRDAKSGRTLYETRATSGGLSPGGLDELTATFQAAMKDFPHPAVNPRRISVEMPR